MQRLERRIQRQAAHRRLARDRVLGGDVGSVVDAKLLSLHSLPGPETVRASLLKCGSGKMPSNESMGAARVAKRGRSGGKGDGKKGRSRLVDDILSMLLIVVVVIAVVGGEGRVGAGLSLYHGRCRSAAFGEGLWRSRSGRGNGTAAIPLLWRGIVVIRGGREAVWFGRDPSSDSRDAVLSVPSDAVLGEPVLEIRRSLGRV